MRINYLEVDGFGVWSGLRLEGFDEGLNVIYGPNEAGKTTLLEFVRSMLYGFSRQRRRYLPPLRGGRPGGSIHVTGAQGRFQICRHDDATGSLQGELALVADDGTRQGEHLLKVLLGEMDESIFNNVFGISLEELQELSTLGDTEASRLLYSLTAGLDRVSLVEVMRELELSRNRILAVDGQTCQTVQLLAEREKLRNEIEELGQLNRRYGRIAAERVQLQRELARLEEEKTQVQYHTRVTELAIALRPRCQQRAELERQLAILGQSKPIPEEAIQRLDALNARLHKYQQRLEAFHQRRDQLREEGAGLTVSETLRRQSARIEALAEQQAWIKSITEQRVQIETNVTAIQQELETERQHLGLDVDPQSLPDFSSRRLRSIRPAARAMQQSHRRLAEAQKQVAAARQAAEALDAQLSAALESHGQRDLAAAMDRIGGEVAQLRRRAQIDERLEELGRSQNDLEEQGHEALHAQLLPAWVLVGLGGMFVCGAVLVVLGLLVSAELPGKLGWVVALIGVAGFAAAGVSHFLLGFSNDRHLETSQKQGGLLKIQIKQTEEERDALDKQLPRGGGPILSRLERAQQELAILESLVPLDAKRQSSRQDSDMAARKVDEVRRELSAARRGWREVLESAGLPEQMTPKQIRAYLQLSEKGGQIRRRLQQQQEELQQRRAELDSFAARVRQVSADAKEEMVDEDPLQQLAYLVESLAEQQQRVRRREKVRRQLRKLRRKETRFSEAAARLKYRRRQLLQRAGVEGEQELRQQAAEHARAEGLRKDRDALAREITAAIGGHCPEQAITEQIQADVTAGRLEAIQAELSVRLERLEKQLHERFETRGQMSEQLKAMAEDRQLPGKQLELAIVEKRLEDAIRRWQVLAVTNRVLESIRVTYEKHRQPETLQEASGYLERLTRGRYTRVWTPLGQQVLRVDDEAGNAHTVEQLSRGTREQLFLALRMGLARCYAQRGVALPMVLDDVLVNYDADRAKAAAEVLRDFAAAGQQVLVFTCHEHVFKLFKALRVASVCLPSNSEPLPTPIVLEAGEKKKERPAAPEPRRRRRKIAASVEAEEPVDKPIVLEDEEDSFTEEERDEYQWEEVSGEDDDAEAA
jgi:uncharacterized protein YhaN